MRFSQINNVHAALFAVVTHALALALAASRHDRWRLLQLYPCWVRPVSWHILSLTLCTALRAHPPLSEIQSLDSDMQNLVHENYNKFISATDTIRKMKHNVEE